MCKEITREETRVALGVLDRINENIEKGREEVVIDYISNALGIGSVEEIISDEFIKDIIGEIKPKKATKSFEKENIEKVEMTIQEAIIHVEDLLYNLENEQETEIDGNDIVALRKILCSKKNKMKLNIYPTLKVNSCEQLEFELRRLEKLGLIDEGDYRYLIIEVDGTLK